MRTAIIALAAAAGLATATFSAGARAADGCGPGWHPVPGHWVAGEWEPTRCAPSDRGGDWSAPYPAYPRYETYEVYPAPYAVYPADPYWYWRPY